MSKKLENALYQALSLIKSPQEFKLFLSDLCTPQEILDFSLRWDVAQRLNQGETIREICHQTGASSTTVTRINRCLKAGKGYRFALERVHHHQHSSH